MDGAKARALTWSPPVWRELLNWPLPHRQPTDRFLLKAAALIGRRQVRAVRGLENLTLDPFILVANHASRREALVLPTVLMLHRGGRPVHFLADWNFQLIPGVGMLYRRAGAITVGRKPARPRILNLLKPLFVDKEPALERARQRLLAGQPVAIFPEGTVNRDPVKLLSGRFGAARLSLETGVPIVPVGICFPEREAKRLGPMEIAIGAPLIPARIDQKPAPLAVVRRWHSVAMTEIARLSGKHWTPRPGDEA